MKILVTGAGGYIGSHVVKYLLDNNIEVIANDFNDERLDKRAVINTANIFEVDNPYKVLGEADVCIHLAWKDGFVHNSNAHMEYLSDHYKFIDKMLSSGLKQMVVMGSMHEVGYYEGAIDENTPCNPLSLYGIAKDALRRSSKMLAEKYGALWQWIRAYYIFGDDKYASSIFAKLQQAASDGKKIFPFTTGKNKYDFIHIEKLAEMISQVALQKEVTGIINCCSGKPVSLAEQVEWYIKENKLDIKLEYGVFPDRAYDSPAVWGNSEKIDKIFANIK